MDADFQKPNLIKGNIFRDGRGELLYNNDFNLDNIKRFYIISHSSVDTIRAWHGHQFEQKFFLVIKGTFLICSVRIDDWQHPSKSLVPYCYKLCQEDASVLSVPKGYANGLKALEANSSVLVFSNFSVKDSLKDDYRFDQNLWLDWENIR